MPSNAVIFWKIFSVSIGVSTGVVVYKPYNDNYRKMKIEKVLAAAALFTSLATTLSSCYENQDPGPLQQQEKEYNVADFDRLEIGDALNVTVSQGAGFSVNVNGDRRNIDDLEVQTIGSSLRMKFNNNGRPDVRQHPTYITIVMPTLSGVLFSGAVSSTISGFVMENKFDVELSGASQLDITGSATHIDANLSGASKLYSFGFETQSADIQASGASKAEVMATQSLKATASGASKIRYRGNPTLNVYVSGASSIGAD